MNPLTAIPPVQDRLEPAVRPRRPVWRSVLIAAAYVLWVGLLCWGGLRFFWWWRFGVGVTATPGVETVWQFFYPELYRSGAMNAKLGPDDGRYDVLLLGGSVLEQSAPAFQRRYGANSGTGSGCSTWPGRPTRRGTVFSSTRTWGTGTSTW